MTTHTVDTPRRTLSRAAYAHALTRDDSAIDAYYVAERAFYAAGGTVEQRDEIVEDAYAEAGR